MHYNKMESIFQSIVRATLAQQPLLAVLIDPEKIELAGLSELVEQIHETEVTHILVGGSTDKFNATEKLVKAIKGLSNLPVILFPGSFDQITESADALLFLSLISGRNPEYLIEQQVQGAAVLKNSSLEIIPTGYILINGGTDTAVAEISNTEPIDQHQIDTIIHTALAGQYLGHKLLYLEAGSGARNPVESTVIRAVKNAVSVPLIVGGGIRSKQQIDAAYLAGADIVVIGTAFEENEHFFKQLKQ